MVTPQPSPWESEDALPLKPADKGDYGYLRMGRLVSASREELIRRCSVPEVPEIELVWHTESDRLVEVSEVPFLQEALRERDAYADRQSLWLAFSASLVFSYSAWLARDSGSILLYLSLAVITGYWPLLSGLYYKWRGEPDTPREFPSDGRRFARWLAAASPKATWTLAGSILVLGLLQPVIGWTESIHAAGLIKPAVQNGEWWRLLTAPVLHGHILHLLLNLSALVTLGKLVEVLASRHHLATVFCFSSFAGALFSCIFLPGSTSVGASGGIMGLLGFLVVLGLRHRASLPEGFARSLTLSLLLITAIGLVGYQFVDNAAHLGGFMAGLLGGCFLIPRAQPIPLRATPASRLLGYCSAAIIVASILMTIDRLFS